jgi:hypothetical protein
MKYRLRKEYDKCPISLKKWDIMGHVGHWVLKDGAWATESLGVSGVMDL